MTDQQPERRDEADPVPRDMPDQQAADEGDRLDADPEGADEGASDGGGELPDVDEAGAGPRGAARGGGVHPEQPVPDESSG
ncbi:hypothetical protein AB0M39_15960 [Streptomyces sp. NPDC051907]|uniref:hypothetical protein n=1 Tax=Streptomyces sp. NPDC051907 TaxID=3155284 RepID=UPI00341C66CD